MHIMRGYRRPKTTAFTRSDADKDADNDADHFGLLEKAFKGQQYRQLDDSASSRNKGWETKRRSVPITFADIPSSDEDEGPEILTGEAETQQKGHANAIPPVNERPASLRHSGRRLITPPHLMRGDANLPPTPPTMANSDDMEPKGNSVASNPQFADAVRNALQSRKSGIETPTRQLLTPEPSPPRTAENLRPTPLRPTLLHPLSASTQRLRQYPSSRADSFHTARENPNASQTHLPQSPSPDHLQSRPPSRPLFGLINEAALVGSGLATPVSTSFSQPQRHDSDQKALLPQSSSPQQKRRSRSPYQPSPPDGGLDNHISYLSDADDDKPASAENLNNLIYKQIREDNVKRHSAMSNNSNAVPVGVFFPLGAAKEHKLRRAPKAQSLRNVSGSDATSQRDSTQSATKQLRHRKALPVKGLDSSPPLIESNTGARRKGTDREMDQETATKITSMTKAYMHERPRTDVLTPRTKNSRVEPPHSLRRSPKEARIESTPKQSPELDTSPRARSHSLRHAFIDLGKSRNNSLETSGSVFSSSRKGSDPRVHHPSTTPFSTSQMSDTTNVELCEAHGISLFPHNNKSLLVVQQNSRSASKDGSTPSPPTQLGITSGDFGLGNMLLAPMEDDWKDSSQSSPESALSKRDIESQGSLIPSPVIHVDSPLTNPRAAPQPPVLAIIPPTPNEELDRQLTMDEHEDNPPRPAVLQRRESLAQRARRYSESLIVQPLFGRTFSQRQPKSLEVPETRPTHLSPLWRPNYIWEGSDSEDDEYEDDIDYAPRSHLPRGGSTDQQRPQRKSIFFPRNMSVRMPGFRGQGGFLLGNSLGLDRHGTNNRRHHVASRSSGGMHTGSDSGYVGERTSTRSLRSRQSQEMLKQMSGGGKGSFTLPFSGGRRVKYVGLGQLKARMSQMRARNQEKKREKRRQMLRGKIQHPT